MHDIFFNGRRKRDTHIVFRWSLSHLKLSTWLRYDLVNDVGLSNWSNLLIESFQSQFVQCQQDRDHSVQAANPVLELVSAQSSSVVWRRTSRNLRHHSIYYNYTTLLQ